MTLVWETVQDHNRNITIESTPGVGTTLTLYFPATLDEMNATVQRDLVDYRGKGESVLVIDDVEEQRSFASGILIKLGYTVGTAQSGEEAITKVKEQEFDILVLDMIMPGGIDGLTTYQQIIALSPGQKAIIASGFQTRRT